MDLKVYKGLTKKTQKTPNEDFLTFLSIFTVGSNQIKRGIQNRLFQTSGKTMHLLLPRNKLGKQNIYPLFLLFPLSSFFLFPLLPVLSFPFFQLRSSFQQLTTYDATRPCLRRNFGFFKGLIFYTTSTTKSTLFCREGTITVTFFVAPLLYLISLFSIRGSTQISTRSSFMG